MKPTVFVVNQPVDTRSPKGKIYDPSPALQYGEIKFVFTADMPLPSSDPERAVNQAHDALKNISIDDYIVWAGGDPLGMLIVSAIASDLLNGDVKFLKWERSRNRDGSGYYSVVPLILFPGENDESD